MTPEIETSLSIVCPGCGDGRFDVTHLMIGSRSGARKFGWWGCRGCRTEISGSVSESGVFDIEHRERPPGGLALMTMGGRYFVLTQSNRIEADNQDFFYHSHQCPTNLLRDVEEVFDPEHGKDPHGILRYVASIDATPESTKALHDMHTLAELFALFQTDGQPPSGAWPESNGGMLDFIARWRRDGNKQGDA